MHEQKRPVGKLISESVYLSTYFSLLMPDEYTFAQSTNISWASTHSWRVFGLRYLSQSIPNASATRILSHQINAGLPWSLVSSLEPLTRLFFKKSLTILLLDHSPAKAPVLLPPLGACSL